MFRELSDSKNLDSKDNNWKRWIEINSWVW